MDHNKLIEESEKIFLGELSSRLLRRAALKAKTQAIARRRTHGDKDPAAALRQAQGKKFARGADGLPLSGEEWRGGQRAEKGAVDSYGRGEVGFDDPRKKFEPGSDGRRLSHSPDTPARKVISTQSSVATPQQSRTIEIDQPVGRRMRQKPAEMQNSNQDPNLKEGSGGEQRQLRRIGAEDDQNPATNPKLKRLETKLKHKQKGADRRARRREKLPTEKASKRHKNWGPNKLNFPSMSPPG